MYPCQSPFKLDLVTLGHFIVFSLLSCPPNYLWQSWLEKAFPGYTSRNEPGTTDSIAQHPTIKAMEEKAAPALKTLNEKATAATTALSENETIQSIRRRATEGVETVKAKAQEIESRTGISLPKSPTTKTGEVARSWTFSTADGQTIETKADTLPPGEKRRIPPRTLNIKNTAIKFALDQTLGAVVNNLLFISGIGALRGESVRTILSSVQTVRMSRQRSGQFIQANEYSELPSPTFRRTEAMAIGVYHQLHTCSRREAYRLRRDCGCWLGYIPELAGRRKEIRPAFVADFYSAT